MKKIIFTLISVLALTACGPQTPEEIEKAKQAKIALDESVQVFNKNSLKNPVTIGETSDGSVVLLTHVKYICPTCTRDYDVKDHYVYSVNGVTSNNYIVASGKSYIPHVEVNIGKNATKEDILAAADKIREDMKRQEKEKYELYQQLKKEYEGK